jgi:hypothetical protein
MKHLAIALFLTLSGAAPTFAQPAAPVSAETPALAEPSDAKAAFEKLKTLAGTWIGPLTVTPDAGSMTNMFGQLTMRVTSRGNALVHEISVAGIPDHPVTMFYVDGDALYATHYCDAGNRPRLEGTMSADGNKLTFEFLDLSGSGEHGHMLRGVFTFVDENHHTEEWTFKFPNGEFTGRFDLQRTNVGEAADAASAY